MHALSYRQLDNVLRRYHNIESSHCQQLATLVPELDNVNSMYFTKSRRFYRQIAGKLASYLDTTVFQTRHML